MLRSFSVGHRSDSTKMAARASRPCLVVGVEAIEHAGCRGRTRRAARSPSIQRHDQFRARGRIAGDMARERIHVGDALGASAGGGGAAHALAERDAHAGRQALERTDHQLGAVVEIEADPVEVGQRVVDQRRQVGGVGDAVALAGQQAARLLGELGVLLGLGAAEGGATGTSASPWMRDRSVAAPDWLSCRPHGQRLLHHRHRHRRSARPSPAPRCCTRCARAALRAVGMKPVASGCVLERARAGATTTRSRCRRRALPSPSYDESIRSRCRRRRRRRSPPRWPASVSLAPILARLRALGRAAPTWSWSKASAAGWRRWPTPGAVRAGAALELPVILVVGMKLGCLNHARLSERAIAPTDSRWPAGSAIALEPGPGVRRRLRCAAATRAAGALPGAAAVHGDGAASAARSQRICVCRTA